MGWPLPQDYQEALQNPRLSFSNPDLQRSTPRLDVLGLPRPITGAFASVYEVSVDSKRWAVRCFLKQFQDQRDRYDAITKHLQEVDIPCTVDFKFEPQGILVKGQWYPILKMEWIDGIPLALFIEQNLHRPDVLKDLAREWLQVMVSLKKGRLAHGDLQHGNILVSNNRLRLIDYDGMFVPALAGLESHEIGHRNYQHPARSARDFGLYVDNFSAWVIYISIVSVSVEPKLWKQLNAGENQEKLLFTKDDFDTSRSSAAFQILGKNRQADIQALSAIFRSFLYLAPKDVPMVDGTLTSIDHTSTAKILPDWISTVEITKAEATGPKQLDTSWVIDHLPRQKVEGFTGQFYEERVLLVTDVILTSFLLYGIWTELITDLVALYIFVVALIFSSITLTYFYRSSTPFNLKHSLVIQKREELKKKREMDSLISNISKALNLAKEAEGKGIILIGKKQQKIDKQYHAELEALQKNRSDNKSRLSIRLGKINNDAAEKDQRLNAQRQASLATILRKRQNHVDARNKELAAALRDQQAGFLQTQLRTISLDGAAISGIGSKLISRLAVAGVCTAAEVDYWRVRRVDGIGHVKAQALMGWKKRVENALLSAAGLQKLSSRIEMSIMSKYDSALQDLILEEQKVGKHIDDELRKSYAYWQPLRQAVELELSQLEVQTTHRMEALQAQYKRDTANLVSETKEVRDRASALITDLTSQVGLKQKALAATLFRLASLEADLASYSRVTVRSYLRKIATF